MAEDDVRIGGRKYELACRDGDEDRLRALGEMVDRKAAEVGKSMGGLNEVRQLLYAALLLADELNEEVAKAKAAPAPAPATADPEVVAMVVEELAARVEALAARLENNAANA